MAILYVTEYADASYAAGLSLPIVMEPGTTQIVTYTTSTQSVAFNPNTKFVRIHSDGICSVKFGTNPTAVANTDRRLIAGQTEIVAVPPGQSYKVAVVVST